MSSSLFSLFALLFALMLASPAWSHGDEDHSHDEEPVLQAAPSLIPRASAQSEEFELVAVLAEQQLTLYLDHYASNAPVTDAQIEVESGAFKAVALQTEPGVYTLPGAAFKQPGKYPLVFSIETETSADLLTTTLEVPQPVLAAAASEHGEDHRLIWAAAAALVLLVVGVAGFVVLRRRHAKHG
jgi:hypothetical protein